MTCSAKAQPTEENTPRATIQDHLEVNNSDVFFFETYCILSPFTYFDDCLLASLKASPEAVCDYACSQHAVRRHEKVLLPFPSKCSNSAFVKQSMIKYACSEAADEKWNITTSEVAVTHLHIW